MNPVVQLAVPFDSPVARIVLAGVLGLFLGLEREWSDKPAGIRTFSLISLLAAVFMTIDRAGLLAVGGLLVIVQGTVLAVQGYGTKTSDCHSPRPCRCWSPTASAHWSPPDSSSKASRSPSCLRCCWF